MAKSKTDEKTLALIKEVRRQRDEIAKAERPAMRTNCVFCFNETKLGDPVNIHVVSDVRVLLDIAGFITAREAAYDAAVRLVGVESPPPFTWQGFLASDWTEDIKLRINKIQIASKKKKLEALETRLSAIVSPELRASLELEAIEAELAG